MSWGLFAGGLFEVARTGAWGSYCPYHCHCSIASLVLAFSCGAFASLLLALLATSSSARRYLLRTLTVIRQDLASAAADQAEVVRGEGEVLRGGGDRRRVLREYSDALHE
jgi:hypothetical protein